MANVACRERRLSGGGNAGDLDVAHLEAAPGTLLVRGDAARGERSRLVEGLNPTCELLREQLVECLLQLSASPAGLEEF